MDKNKPIVSELIKSLYEKWEAKSPSNNPSKLARKMDTTFTTVRNMINGAVSRPSYYLFDKFIRSVDVEKEEYLGHINQHYPEFVEVAKRYVESSYDQANSDDMSWIVRDDTASDIFQKIIGCESVSKKKIISTYGDKGKEVITKLSELENIVVKNDEIKAVGGERRQLDGKLGLGLLKKNTARFSVEKCGGDGTRAVCLQMNTTKKCINEVRDRIDMFFEDICKYLESNKDDSGDTYTLNFVMSPID